MRDRRDIRRKLRELSERAKAPAPPPPPAKVEVACICGQLLRLPADQEEEERRCSCPACKRKFLMTFTEDKGRRIPCPVYLDDTASAGDTHVAEAPGAVSRAPKGKGGMDDAFGPPPPAALVCVCPGCASKMKVRQQFFDKRAKCPDCGVRILLTVVYDPGAKAHSIQPLRITDAPSGDTWHLDG